MAIFDLPTSHNDLQQTENLIDSLQSLAKLDSVVHSIFDRILSRVTAEQNRVNSVKERSITAREKITRISNNQARATTIFSTSKHPCTKPPPNHRTLFEFSNDPLSGDAPYAPPDPEIEYVTSDPATSTLNNANDVSEMNNLFTRLNPHATEMVRVEILMEEQGVGPLPTAPALQSTAEVLLFNSRKNPYERYSRLDNLVGTDGVRRDSGKDKEKDMMHAPQTLVDGDLLPDVAGLDLMFKPELGEMNNLNLPTNLNLANLADVQFGGAEGKGIASIAPSQYQQANQLMLPAIEGFGAAPSATEGIANPVAAPAAGGGAPPPPPPPSAGAPPPPPPSAAAAPPPPPPPSIESAASSAAAAASSSLPPAPAKPAAGGPMDLLAAIRNKDEAAPLKKAEVNKPKPAKAGAMSLLDQIQGKSKGTLKKAAQRVIAAKKTEKDVSKPLSMFEQLQESMNRRQAAISGKQDRKEQKRETVALMQGADTFRKDIRSSLIDADGTMPKIRGESDFDEGSSSDSDEGGRGRVFSDATDDSAEKKKAKKKEAAPKKVVKVKIPKGGARKGKGGAGEEEGEERRGSMWDNKSLNRMLTSTSMGGAEGEGGGSSDDGDWD